MTYEIEFKPRAIKDLEGLSKDIQRRILAKIESLADDLAGDVKRLTNFTPEYRLRLATIAYYLRLKRAGLSFIARCIVRTLIDRWNMKLHPEILQKNGKKEFVVLPYDEFLAIQERLNDADDLIELRKANRSEGKKKAIPLADVKRKLRLR